MVDGIEKLPAARRAPDASSRGGERTDRIVTVPNVLCAIRLLGSVVLAALAVAGRSELFFWLFVALAFTDWLDGKLAILLRQKSVLGARLDSWADAALYAALLFGVLWLHGSIIRAELGWILPGVASYGISTTAGFWKFRRWPSYHTRAAKISWFLVAVAVVCLFEGWTVWPIRVAAAAVILTNLEALLITILSTRWRADLESVVHVLRERNES